MMDDLYSIDCLNTADPVKFRQLEEKTTYPMDQFDHYDPFDTALVKMIVEIRIVVVQLVRHFSQELQKFFVEQQIEI